jgi:hypothetical protein
MAILAQNGTASPQTSAGNPVNVTVSAVLASTDLTPTPVDVTYTSDSTCASVTAATQSVTIPPAASFLAPGVLPISQPVRLTGTGARPCMVAVDIKVWPPGGAGNPAGPLAQTVAMVGLL